ncbi:MAG: hypothetical protein CM1200mP34_4290 [Verrucomicrobiales bacterium]|nr:MAG: hypothetical protein CM1200mP34_4290 [Verrucomicrobiales bacterium]
MGMSHGKEETYPRLADVLGFCTPQQVTDVAEKIVTTQRDFGDRADRGTRVSSTPSRIVGWTGFAVKSRVAWAMRWPSATV